MSTPCKGNTALAGRCRMAAITGVLAKAMGGRHGWTALPVLLTVIPETLWPVKPQKRNFLTIAEANSDTCGASRSLRRRVARQRAAQRRRASVGRPPRGARASAGAPWN
jgi:hypothetical protein